MIFWKEATFPRRLEADLMLVLNKSLKRARIPTYTRLSKMRYSQSGTISSEKSNMEDLIRDYLNALVCAAKSIDESVIRIEALE